MTLYKLASWYDNNEKYDANLSGDVFYGIFSTIEKAKEYAEKLIESEKTNYYDKPATVEVVNDWKDGEKAIIVTDMFDTRWDICYTIEEIEVDPEYKED